MKLVHKRTNMEDARFVPGAPGEKLGRASKGAGRGKHYL